MVRKRIWAEAEPQPGQPKIFAPISETVHNLPPAVTSGDFQLQNSAEMKTAYLSHAGSMAASVSAQLPCPSLLFTGKGPNVRLR